MLQFTFKLLGLKRLHRNKNLMGGALCSEGMKVVSGEGLEENGDHLNSFCSFRAPTPQ